MRILQSVRDELLAEGERGRALQEEVGGFVLISVLTGLADGYLPCVNAALPVLRPTHFGYDAAEVLHAISRESPRGRSLASFHTHLVQPAVVSDADAEAYRQAGSKYAFIHGSDGLKCFVLQDDGSYEEESIEVVSSDASE